jgi:hypothetical protein
MSPPALSITHPHKRKLPAFIMKNEARTVKKVVHFHDEIDEIPSDEEALKLEQMYDAFNKLNDECNERMLSTRLDAGEILEEGEIAQIAAQSPQGSEASDCSWEFDLDESSATDEVGPDDIFDFIWKYVSDHQQDIYRRFGSGGITRDMAEDYLRNAPRDLLQVLEIALEEAERKVNQFSA